MSDRQQWSTPILFYKKCRINCDSPVSDPESISSADLTDPHPNASPRTRLRVSAEDAARSAHGTDSARDAPAEPDPKLDSENGTTSQSKEQSSDGQSTEANQPRPSPTYDSPRELLSSKPAIHEEIQGLLSYVVVTNDGTRDSLLLLTDLKSVIQHQLPKMPKEYITRLVLARNHYSMLLIRKDTNKCLGGVTFLPFAEKGFAEVVFLAIDGVKQTQGYGSRLMAYLKDYVRDKFNIDYLLTYADNLAIGYFKKQGFAADITLDKSVWAGCIKDYEEATILQCTFYPKVRYTQIKSIISAQRKAIYEKIKDRVCPFVVYGGVQDFDSSRADPLSIAGVRESGWTPELDAPPTESQDRASLLKKSLKKFIGEMRASPNAWPFLEPVTGVPDYYDIIKEPIDLHTISYRIDDGEYSSFEAFERDVNLIFQNCRIYNDESTLYVKCANKLERWFKGKTPEFKAEIAPVISPQQRRIPQSASPSSK